MIKDKEVVSKKLEVEDSDSKLWGVVSELRDEIYNLNEQFYKFKVERVNEVYQPLDILSKDLEFHINQIRKLRDIISQILIDDSSIYGRCGTMDNYNQYLKSEIISALGRELDVLIPVLEGVPLKADETKRKISNVFG